VGAAPPELRGSAFGVLAAIQSFGDLAARAGVGLIWSLTSPVPPSLQSPCSSQLQPWRYAESQPDKKRRPALLRPFVRLIA
jgi:hypothetical protein